MSQQFLSANPLLSRSDSNSHRAHMFQALLGSSEAVPLDGSGIYSIVRTNRYQQLVATLAQGQSIKQNMEEQCHSLTLANITLKKQVQLYKQKLILYQQNERQLENQLNRLAQQVKQSQQRILDVQDQLKRQKMNPRKNEPQVICFNQLPKKTIIKQTGSQTCWEQEQEPSSVERNQQNIIQPEKNDPQKMQNRLYQILRSNAEIFQQQFKERLKRLEDCQMTLENWEKEKEHLRQENQRLKQEAYARSLEEEKIKIWQENVSNFMQNIQKNIIETKEQIRGQEMVNREQWERQALERGKIAELRLRIKEAEKQMHVEQKGDEDGPVVTLVRLSQQIKSIVRGMLIQSEYS